MKAAKPLIPIVCFALGMAVAGLSSRPPKTTDPGQAEPSGAGSLLIGANVRSGRDSRAPLLVKRGDQKVTLSSSQFDTFIRKNKNLDVLVGLKVNPNILKLLGIDSGQTAELQEAISDTIRSFHAEDVARREVIYNQKGEVSKIIVPAYPEKGEAMMAALKERIRGIMGDELGAAMVPAFDRSLAEWTAKQGQVRREFELTETSDGRIAFHVSLDGGNPSTYFGVNRTFVPSQWAHIVRIEADE